MISDAIVNLKEVSSSDALQLLLPLLISSPSATVQGMRSSIGESGVSDSDAPRRLFTCALLTLAYSRQALKKYVKANNDIKAQDAMFDSLFNRALKTGVDKGVFAQPKGMFLSSPHHDLI